MRILLLEGNAEDAALVKEVLLEIEEIRRWRNWIRSLDLVHLERIEDAAVVLAEEQFDAALAGSRLPGAGGLVVLFSLRALAPDMPVILLSSGDEDTFAVSAVREGADDCLPLDELDCAVLARSLRKAVERNRRARAMRSALLLDMDTGMFNHRGFLAVAERDCRVARCLNRPVFLAVAALGGSAATPESEPTAIELAAALRGALTETDLIARLDSRRFAVLSVYGETDQAAASLEALARRFPMRVETAVAGPAADWSIEELLSRVPSPVCENKRSEPDAVGPAWLASA